MAKIPKIDMDLIFKMLKLDKNKKESMYWVIAIFALIILVYIALIIKPKVVDVYKNHVGRIKKRSEITDVKSFIARESLFTKQLNDMHSKIDFYEDKLPTEHEVPMLLEDLSKMAQNTDVKILAIKPVSVKGIPGKGAAKTDKPYKEFPIAITAKSGYHELGAFINKLENAARFMNISDIKIKTNKSSYDAHDINLIVSTYILIKETK